MNPKLKKQIDFARTYRRLTVNKLETTLYLLLFVLPFLILLLLYYSKITYGITQISSYILDGYIPVNSNRVGSSQLLYFFGEVNFLKMPNVIPDFKFILVNFIVALICLIFCATGKRAGQPLSIFLIMVLLTHLSSCLFFTFFSEYFPYTASDYSELYIKQEVSIWISFVIISGLITGFLGFKGIIRRMITMISIMSYSLVFGIIRYIFFMYVIYKCSILYMAVLFFILGPLFDFLYFVFFYGIYIDESIKRYDSEQGRGQWEWA